MAQILSTAIDSINIYLRDDGRFEAVIDGRTVTRSKRGDIEKLIRARCEPIKAIEANDYYGISTSKLIRVTGVHKNGNFLTNEGEQVRDWYAYHYEEEEFTQLREIEEEMQQLGDRRNALLYELGHLQPKELDR